MTSSRRPLTRTRRLWAMGALSGALVLSVAACSSDSDSSADEPRERVSSAASAASSAAANEPDTAGDASAAQDGPKVAYDDAIAAAQKEVPDAKVTEAEYDDDGDGDWEVDLITDEPRVHNVTVDATSGEVVRTHEDRIPDGQRDRLKYPLAKLDAASVSLDDAADKALENAGGGYVSKISIQGTEQRPKWDVEVTDGRVQHELDIDAKTGEVVSKETDQED
ncbi:PepSY domain-containing protein [Streptomyces sp. YC504]|uniref:PepSY domain-containing protein n=1 Tax=Streptomyces mesophilus TaxID=1775132 RepID=A0A6G4XPE3_9ACTN|nr:PepSY domain-containing protein [Streptomyces mesophilus]NGO79062.1 PepSY domain-containing protein [Streptomyces mesophilus]